MNCSNCQTKLMGSEKFCPNCGQRIGNEISTPVDKAVDGKRSASIVLGILSLIGVFFIVFAPLSFILGVIGLVLAIKANRQVNNIAGIVLNAVGALVSAIIIGLFILLIRLSFGIIQNIPSHGDFDINNIISEYTEKYNNFDQNF